MLNLKYELLCIDDITVTIAFIAQKLKMGDLDDYDFSTGDAGASNVYNMEAGQIRVGG